MKNLFLVLCLLFVSSRSFFSQAAGIYNTYQQEMDEAYLQYPNLPKGILEAVSYKMTHYSHKDGTEQQSCFGLPKVYGVMGLTEDGQGYFRSNLKLVSQLSGYSEIDIKTSPQKNILAYAAAYNQLLLDLGVNPTNINEHDNVIMALSEIPLDGDLVNDFAMNSRLYGVFKNLKESSSPFANHVNLEAIFGIENLKVLSCRKVNMLDGGIASSNGDAYAPSINLKSSQYGPAIWSATPSCNRSSRSGTAISAVTVHTIQGSYAGAISWAKNCTSNVSYHYVARSSDGQITQMVDESQKAWHVGSANPYAIGIEHEGYVSDASWYTTAMYNGSANLVRDITQSGYGMLPTRTYFGAPSSGTNTLGACTHIKGHQHFPNQNHTDPGVNWNWKRYYHLINNSPNVTTETAANGTYFDTGGTTGDYSNDERTLKLIQPTGASTVTISFSQFDLENNWDFLLVYDGATTNSPLVATLTGSSTPSNITSTSGSILLEFRSDCATTSPGWKIAWSSNGNGGTQDIVAPTSIVTTVNTWEVATFNSMFTDVDNTGGSGIKEKYIQVIHNDGTEWRANDVNGFLKDNFDLTVNGDWAQQVGSWSINANHLEQTDESESNSNLFAILDQNIHDKYLYNWSSRIEGTATNKRAGIHFMSDDASFVNRKNSYFVYFRSDDNKIQIYKVTNDVFSLEKDFPYTINDNQWYDNKVTYNKTTGEINIWIDNNHVTSWTDPSPLTVGNYFSLRSGNCKYMVDNLNVYHGRGVTEAISVGTSFSDDLRYQNQSPSVFAGRIKSLVVDNQNNISTVSSKDIYVDWTSPLDVTTVNDGTGADINNTTNNTQLSANWTASSDQHSGITRYWYAIGTSPGATDIKNWTDNWFNTSVTAAGLSLTSGTVYYFSIKSENGAGLFSNVANSDGQIVDNPNGPPIAGFTVPNSYICSSEAINLINTSLNATSYQWSVASGGVIVSPNSPNTAVTFTNSGSYVVTLTANGPGGTDVSSQTINVSVDVAPVAAANLNSETVCIDDPMVTFVNQSQNANGYLWDFGDGGTSTDANPWHLYAAVGVYNVTLTAINGTCPNAVEQFTVTVDNCSSVEESSDLTNVLVFPNPAVEELTLVFSLKKSKDFEISLFDLSGRKVVDLYKGLGEIGNHTLHFNLQEKSLAAGTYQLVLSGEDFRTVKPLIIR